MSDKIYPTQKMVCPHCQEEQEENASSYVIPGRIGNESRVDSQCEHCDEEFSAELLKDGWIEVQEL